MSRTVGRGFIKSPVERDDDDDDDDDEEGAQSVEVGFRERWRRRFPT